MNLGVGIIGLPNVGKSTLFNALRKAQGKLSGLAMVANYPFTTIEPNIGVVPVPDARLTTLAEVTKEEEKMTTLPPIKPAIVNFVDIAGLVKGAAEGAGLGNKFLSHIREVSVITHVVRAFTDENIIKEGSVDPKTDYQTIQTELSLADLSTAEKIAASWKSRNKVKPTVEQFAAEKLFQGLNKGLPAREIELTEDEEVAAQQFFLLSKKPEIIVLNVTEDEYIQDNIPKLINKYSELLEIAKEKIIVICAKIEAELADLTEEEQQEYLKELGLKESGLERLIKKAYETLGLISFLTAGEKEIRAWTIQKGTKAVDAAGVIHTDFTAHFIKAEVVSYEDFVEHHGWKGSREHGKTRMEGRDYMVKDGDVVEFRIGK